ncbi:ABC transporter permease [Mariniblastus sp.]|nr:ABC transporter permease [Mariniblastus sp.]
MSDEVKLNDVSNSFDNRSIDAPTIRYSAESEISNPGKLIGGMLRDFSSGRELAWRLFMRNLRGLYRQTVLGLFWAFLPPIVNTAFWVFLREADVFDTGKMPINSTIFILTSMIFWQAFIEAFQMPMDVINKNRNMISKLNFPRESLLMVGFGEVLFNFMIRTLLLVPACLWFQFMPPATVALMPIAALGLIFVGMGWGLILMPIGALYQDVGRFIGLATPFWMILTPVVYMPLMTFPGSLLNWINPASPLLILARDWTLIGSTTHPTAAIIYGIASVALLLIGLVVYRVSIPVLVERMTA